ncbi:hypothetical protein BD779DRAFT_1575368 [Infundibulicybe gibba]|nr:hypothetical protein BD779DRAFT_1575368 [Infundibulicybe gibba]
MFMRVAVHLTVLGSCTCSASGLMGFFATAHIDSLRVGVAIMPPSYVSRRFEVLILIAFVVFPFRSVVITSYHICRLCKMDNDL